MRIRHDDVRDIDVPLGWAAISSPSLASGPVEYLAIGPGGVLAIAHWPGQITIVHDVVHQDGQRREVQAAALVDETTRLAGLVDASHRDTVAPLVVADGDHLPVTVPPGLVLVGESLLAGVMARLPRRLETDDIDDVVGRIAKARSRRIGELPTQATLSAALLADRRIRRIQV